MATLCFLNWSSCKTMSESEKMFLDEYKQTICHVHFWGSHKKHHCGLLCTIWEIYEEARLARMSHSQLNGQFRSCNQYLLCDNLLQRPTSHNKKEATEHDP